LRVEAMFCHQMVRTVTLTPRYNDRIDVVNESVALEVGVQVMVPAGSRVRPIPWDKREAKE
jgi:hypothetical protein